VSTKVHSRRAPVLAAAGLVMVTACGGDEVELLSSFDELSLDTLFVVGAAEGEAWETFGGIWDVEAAPDGRFAVLDLEAPAVHVFDARGSHIGSITETGLGPGALDRPSGITWSGAGTLQVWDPGSSWISRFAVSASGVRYTDRRRAFAFGETGFCSTAGRTYLSYFQWNDDRFLDGRVVHEIGPEGGAIRSFGDAPPLAGGETLGPELLEIATEELTPSGLLCTARGVLDVSFMQSLIRLHDLDGTLMWRRELEDFTPVVAYTDDGMGLGRGFDEVNGSHLLRSVVSIGEGMALVQHEVRRQEIPEEGEPEVFESRLIRIADGVEVDRTRALPLFLAGQGRRLYEVRERPFPQVIVLERRAAR
jgi:hypothetical protein